MVSPGSISGEVTVTFPPTTVKVVPGLLGCSRREAEPSLSVSCGGSSASSIVISKAGAEKLVDDAALFVMVTV